MTTKTTEFTIPLSGVESEHCALIVDKAISTIKGITKHQTDSANSRSVVQVNEPKDLIELVHVVRNIGYDVSTVVINFPVLHMTCASCAISVESILLAQPGIIRASVNYANGNAQVEYIPGVIDKAEIKHALTLIGYDALLDEESQEDELEKIHRSKLQQLKLRTIGSIVLSVPLMVVSMLYMDWYYANVVMLALSTPVVIIFGKQFFINAWKQAKHRMANMDTLVALSTGIAYLFSLFNTFFADFWHRHGLHAHVYYESAAVVIAFVLLGKLIEERAKANTSDALKKLIGLQPKEVLKLMPDQTQKVVPLSTIETNDVIVVKPGEKIAVDGIVVSGSSYVNESMLTGEPVPVAKKENDILYAGSINQKGSLMYKATRVGSSTLLAQIIKSVKDAQGSKAPVQKSVDKIAAVFVPIVIGIALLTFSVWLISGGENAFTHAMLSAITVLVIACPCALGLATPTALMVGVGKAAQNGILIRDAESLERAKHITTVVLDKTGTLTEGKPLVSDFYWLNEESQAKSILYQLEVKSEHPLAEAIVNHLGELPMAHISDYASVTGKGVTAKYNGLAYYVGKLEFLQENQIEIDHQLRIMAVNLSNEAKTVVWFANQKKALAVIGIADQIKTGSKQAVKALKDKGIKVVMLTGDNHNTANAVANAVGITSFESNLLPEEKAEKIKQLQQQGQIVAMVGDGINDSTALAQADVSIAMGKGSDIAMDIAKMTIISSDLRKIEYAIKLSSKTVNAIRQNLFWAFVYNVIGIPLAAGVLFPLNGFLLDPMIAGAAMALSSVSVVTNSLLLKFKL